MKLFLRIISGIFLFLAISSCTNSIEIDKIETECKPFIGNPRIEWYSLNDQVMTSNPALGSSFYLMVDKYGECITTSSPYTITIKYYGAAGEEINNLSFDYNYYVTGDQMKIGVAIVFGTGVKYVVVDMYCTADNGQQSNTLTFSLDRPQGAN